MGVPLRYVFHQGPMLKTLARTAYLVAQQKRSGSSAPAVSLPGPEVSAVLPPRPRDLIRDYIRHVGGDPSWYKDRLPHHLFPQWGMPILGKTLESVPYDLTKVLNGGVRLEMLGDLPANEPLEVTGRLVSIDDDGRRAILEQELITGTRSSPRALVAHTYAIVPLASKGAKKERPRVPEGARELGRQRIRPSDGLEFAKLTGDFNPIHWVLPYARAAGQKGLILHGYATLARALETLHRSHFSQDPRRIVAVDVRFTRPLVIPASIGVFLHDGNKLFVGDAVLGPAYLSGEIQIRGDS